MYVLMDLEWFCTRRGNIRPTQLAALRIDENWRELDRFFSRISPDRADTPDWTHIAFSGGKPEDFLCAPTLSAALRNLRMCLQKRGVESLENFGRIFRPPAQHIILLEPHAEAPQSCGQGGRA